MARSVAVGMSTLVAVVLFSAPQAFTQEQMSSRNVGELGVAVNETADEQNAGPLGDGEPLGDDLPEDDGLADAASYASAFGVAQEEAESRLVAQQEFGELVTEIAEAVPDRFAGSTINHRGDFELAVKFTGAEVPTEVARISHDVSRPVSFKPGAARSFHDAEKLIESVGTQLDELAATPGVYYDIGAEEFVLDMVGEPGEAEPISGIEAEFRASLPTDLPAEIREARIELIPRPPALDVRGGVHMTICTTGFSVFSPYGYRRTTTSAHCPTHNPTGYSGQRHGIRWNGRLHGSVPSGTYSYTATSTVLQ